MSASTSPVVSRTNSSSSLLAPPVSPPVVIGSLKFTDSDGKERDLSITSSGTSEGKARLLWQTMAPALEAMLPYVPQEKLSVFSENPSYEFSPHTYELRIYTGEDYAKLQAQRQATSTKKTASKQLVQPAHVVRLRDVKDEERIETGKKIHAYVALHSEVARTELAAKSKATVPDTTVPASSSGKTPAAEQNGFIQAAITPSKTLEGLVKNLNPPSGPTTDRDWYVKFAVLCIDFCHLADVAASKINEHALVPLLGGFGAALGLLVVKVAFVAAAVFLSIGALVTVAPFRALQGLVELIILGGSKISFTSKSTKRIEELERLLKEEKEARVEAERKLWASEDGGYVSAND